MGQKGELSLGNVQLTRHAGSESAGGKRQQSKLVYTPVDPGLSILWINRDPKSKGFP